MIKRVRDRLTLEQLANPQDAETEARCDARIAKLKASLRAEKDGQLRASRSWPTKGPSGLRVIRCEDLIRHGVDVCMVKDR